MKIKKYLVILLILTSNSGLFGQYFWQRIESPTDYFLRTLHFTDSLRGWVAGDSGLIFYTSDGGVNWIQQETNTKDKVMKLFFLDEDRGWAVAWDEVGFDTFYGTDILQTTNGGENWSLEPYREQNVFLNSIYFLDSLEGFMGGYPGKFLITTDGGFNWEDAQIDSGVGAHFPPVHFNFYNNQYGFASGGAMDISGVVWKTTNGGEFWKTTAVGPEPVRGIHFFDSLNVLGVGGDPEYFGASVVRTTDAGENWIYEELGIVGVATAISFRTENEGWAPLSLARRIMYTFDSGATWTDTSTVDSSAIYDLVFTDSLTGYAVGNEGVILKYKYQFPVPVEEEPKLADTYYLFQNYPNPFNSSTSIEYYISNPAQVSLKVYNLLGTLVANLVETYQPDGKYNVTWNADKEASGVYYLRLRVNEKEQVRKLVLLK
ncbi:MAG: YCF48-related protein [Ignavibacteriaceae bacterium]|nr:YCF48-related protein [Ignavibacteriaceae bacterium]